jgi:hypothetical protein
MIGHARNLGSGGSRRCPSDFTVSHYGVNAELIGKTMGVKP